jgi:hypothetical protein
MKLHTFSECLEIAEKSSGKNHLLLGNGFSISLFPEIFNYKKLADEIKSEKIKNIFKSFNTNDFEYVLRKLTDALEVTKLYKESKKLTKEIEEDAENLKKILIDAISKCHPLNPKSISEEQYFSCRNFLNNFSGKIYTLNYDLILYWVLMHFLDDEENRLPCDDGFRTSGENEDVISWEIGREHDQNINYIHGALHIFSKNDEITKYTWRNKDSSIIEQVRESLQNSNYPVFITEGNNKHKIARINANSYLGRSISSLKSIRGNLFIFGHSLRGEDDHIFNIINEVKGKKSNGVSNVFVSVYGDINTKDNQQIVNKIKKWERDYDRRKYYIYEASSAKVWDAVNDNFNDF